MYFRKIDFKKEIVLFLLIVLTVFSCKTREIIELKSELTIDKYPDPPNGIELDSNVFFDATEITNISYQEYVFWKGKIYGKTSKEFLAALPKENVWDSLEGKYSVLSQSYYGHVAYREYPVVGVSYEQAIDFSKWRGDRVMEYLLIKHKIFEYDSVQNKNTVFTIEKYFDGKYKINPSPFLKYYPVFSLPDSATFMKALVRFDSLNRINFKYCKEKYCSELKKTTCLETNEEISEKYLYGPDPTEVTDCSFCKYQLVTHIRGNVREFTTNHKITFGGSYRDSCNAKLFFENKEPNAYTGFRNVCSWKKWKN
ncbi:MAG: gliding motility-associated lipoprotein GldJ [Bacteroidetes bacterium]|jgi:hypothetical protein|nr:gliding motility-associated lipoprotein GldJ [Bacteroidota bacterium]